MALARKKSLNQGPMRASGDTMFVPWAQLLLEDEASIHKIWFLYIFSTSFSLPCGWRPGLEQRHAPGHQPIGAFIPI